MHFINLINLCSFETQIQCHFFYANIAFFIWLNKHYEETIVIKRVPKIIFVKEIKNLSIYYFILFIIIGITATNCFSQRDITKIDTTKKMETLTVKDTIKANDSTKSNTDTTSSNAVITNPKRKKSENALEGKVEYSCKDSINFDLSTSEIYLYNNVLITYQDIKLEATRVDIDFETNKIYAKGIKDSLGRDTGTPKFTQGEQAFESKSMQYNFKTKKGLIKEVITQEGEGYLHGSLIKRMPDETVMIKSGKYTTCDHPHPHFQFQFFKAKVIPNNKIVTGPLYFVLEDVPTPIILPFGFFPNKKGRQNGIIIPTYGESRTDGFFLRDGGYYMGLGKYADAKITGFISTRGSWSAALLTNYKKRYKFDGFFDFNYAETVESEKGLPDYGKIKTFFVKWIYNQDPKAKPNSSFRININAGSTKHHTLRPTNLNNFYQNVFQSSVSYQTRVADQFNVVINGNHSQDKITKRVNLDLPTVSVSSDRYYPFKNENKLKKNKFLENITVFYNFSAANKLSILDSNLFRKSTLDSLNYAINHSIPISSTIKVLKYFSITTSFNYRERWYFKQIEKRWENDSQMIDINGDSNPDFNGRLITDTINKFAAVRDFDIGTSFGTTLYGMYQLKFGPIKAIRHVLKPNIGFRYTPAFGTPQWGYYQSYIDESFDPEQANSRPARYSKFANEMYGTPPEKKSGAITFGLSNNFEAKIRSSKDTTTGFKKISVIDNYTIAASYDLAKDSMRWSDIAMNANTRLFKQININYRSTWTPYVYMVIDPINNIRKPINKFLVNEENRLAKLMNTSWDLSFGYTLDNNKIEKLFQKEKQKEEDNKKKSAINPNEISWSLNFNYNFSYTKTTYATIKEKPIQNLSFSGEIEPTPKWKISFNAAYDYEQKKLSRLDFNFHRDLHCWEMMMQWIPMGYMKSYTFTIRIKAQVLQDVKYEKKKVPWD